MDREKSLVQDQPDQEQSQRPKEPYLSPILIEYGDVVSLTQNSDMGSVSDGASMMIMQAMG